MQLDRKAESTGIARTDRNAAGHGRSLGIALLLGGNIVQGTTKTGRIAGGKEMLGRGGSRLAGTTHGLGNRQICTKGSIFSRRVSVASTGGSGHGGEKGFDVH